MGISEKLMRIQTEIKAPKNLYNSFGKYKYRNAEGICEAVKPYLQKEKCNLTLNDEIIEVGGRVYVKATATLTDCETSECIEAKAFARESFEKKGMDDSQITGTASSYTRKYALNGLLLLDDTKDADTDEYKKQTEGKTEEAEDMKKTEEIGNMKISDVKVKVLHKRCTDEGVDEAKVLSLYKVSDFSELTEKKFHNICENWEKIKVM